MAKPKTDAPAVSVEMWPLANLTPNPRNARVHSPEQVEQIVRSIGEFGFTNPILIDEDGLIVAGHGRSMAARKIYEAGGSIKLPNGKTLPAGDVPVIVAAGWSEDQRRAYTIADNQLALNATWDDDLLRLELGDLKAEEYSLDLVGFAVGDLDRLLTVPAPPAAPAEFPEHDEAIETKHCCPKCGYEWSGVVVDVGASTGHVGTAAYRLTLAAKYEAGATPDEITRKELSLAGFQRPMDPAELEGFTPVFRFGDFAGGIYEKPAV
jgi:hypothetical protein